MLIYRWARTAWANLPPAPVRACLRLAAIHICRCTALHCTWPPSIYPAYSVSRLDPRRPGVLTVRRGRWRRDRSTRETVFERQRHVSPCLVGRLCLLPDQLLRSGSHAAVRKGEKVSSPPPPPPSSQRRIRTRSVCTYALCYGVRELGSSKAERCNRYSDGIRGLVPRLVMEGVDFCRQGGLGRARWRCVRNIGCRWNER